MIAFDLLPDSSQSCIVRATEIALKDIDTIDEMFEIILSGNHKYAQRAARVFFQCAVRLPEILEQYTPELIDVIESNCNDSVRGTLLKIFVVLDLPEDEEDLGKLTEICFEYLNSSSDKESLRINSMEILYKIGRIYPEINQELFINITQLIPHSKIAFQSRAKKILKLLDSIKYTGENDIDL